MTPNPITIDPEAPVATAVAVMQERGIRHLPVVDDGQRFIGMVSDRDLRGVALGPALLEHLSAEAVERLGPAADAAEALRVREVMTWDALAIEPDAPVAQAAALMFERGVSSLGVVERRRLVGIVTGRDLLKALAATLPAVRGGDPDTFFW